MKYLRSFMTREAFGQFMRMVGIGLINTVVDFSLLNFFFAVLGWGEILSVTVALVIASLVAYVLNRRFTFRLGGGLRVRETVAFVAVNVVALLLTNLLVWLAIEQFGSLTQLQLNLVKIVATGLILLPKFAGYRDFVFGRAIAERADDSAESTPHVE
ncbi:MAG: GtrA family protein [Acidimicrobiia bacterium]|nr:GtrA family protein [Acidimicrobiia bacterium]